MRSSRRARAIVAAAQEAWPSSDPFEKEGDVWVGHLGLRFSQTGWLVGAVAGV